MPNIKFNYLYRDAGNYKTFGSVMFADPDHLSLQELEARIRSKLIDGQWFYAGEWQVPDLHTHPWDEELDHGFHEFESLELTEEEVGVGLTTHPCFCPW
ncbi:hypothetical protein [Mucilaginibacter myungsuensis]|uniref:Uncharacterized protein n=1 Tax=Mucilaginibacter myungsuensis TaxID=649104 RepID=A0A929PW96_9SPHI|nr:hypothetical protein [Mucilaginibacter myungsuensis]MBE9661130.1 hypothetical protein [Mucilaginibacter myungsuensis]MDN3597275.1 hypothetical protein [Mucilaginibacter myungsuensis]